MKKKVFIFIKLILATSIIWWMVSTGRLNLDELKEFSKYPSYFVLMIGILFVVNLICSYRWKIILEGQGFIVPLKKTFSIHYTGAFFNSFMPGALGGDIIKAWYIAKICHKSRTRAVTTVLIDRIMGLSAVIFFSFTALLDPSIRSVHPGLSIIFYSTGTAIFLLITGIIAIQSKYGDYLKKLFSKLPLSKITTQIISAFQAYKGKNLILIKAFLITLLVYTGILYIFYLPGKYIMNIPLSLGIYYSIVPIGLLASVIPITPAGIGVGQEAFEQLFLMFSSNMGAELCTVFQLITIVSNMFGIFFYLTYKSEVDAIVENLKEEEINEGETNESKT